jgi:hypothetical protein
MAGRYVNGRWKNVSLQREKEISIRMKMRRCRGSTRKHTFPSGPAAGRVSPRMNVSIKADSKGKLAKTA